MTNRPHVLRGVRTRTSAILVSGGLLTALGVAAALHVGGVYWSQVDVVFLTPTAPGSTGNPLEGEAGNVIDFASLVERRANVGTQTSELTSSGVNLYAQGIRHGSAIALPVTNGQWRPSFRSATLRVEAVGSTPKEVTEHIEEGVARINSISLSTQDQLRVPKPDRITTVTVPNSPAVQYADVDRSRGAFAIALLGGGITAGVASLFAKRRRTS